MNELPIDEPTSVLEFLTFPPQIKSYLELGVRCGRTIFRVSKLVDKAIGVDLSFQNLNIRKSNNIFLYEGSTDKFFKGNSDKFDLIFIDAQFCHYLARIRCSSRTGPRSSSLAFETNSSCFSTPRGLTPLLFRNQIVAG